MVEQTTAYGISTVLEMDHGDAVGRVREVLGAEGFGVLAEIDVAATLQGKLGVAMPPYLILGACNPPLAHRALTAEPDLGLLLPCNVVVRADAQTGRTVVAAMDPSAALGLTANPEVEAVATEVRRRLVRALEALASAQTAGSS